MPSVILSPAGLSDDRLKKFAKDPVVRRMFLSLPAKVNILVCLDALPLASRSLREGQRDGMDRMLASSMRRMGKRASVKLFSFEADSVDSEQDVRCAHIFWQAGGQGSIIHHMVNAINHNKQLLRTVQEYVSLNKLVYVGICLGAMMAGARLSRCPKLAALPMYEFWGSKVPVQYDDNLPDWDDSFMIHITSGVGIAIQSCSGIEASAFIAVKKGPKWEEKRQLINGKLQNLLPYVSVAAEVYAWRRDDGTEYRWLWKLDGSEWSWWTRDEA